MGEIIFYKMNRLILGAFLLILVVGLSSCSVSFEKRKYRPGYHMDIVHHRMKNRTIQKLNTTGNELPSENVVILKGSQCIPAHDSVDPSDPVITSSSSEPKTRYQDRASFLNEHKVETDPPPAECDVIVMINGYQIQALIVEISETEVKYRKCGEPEGPIYYLSLDNVLNILLKNGDTFAPKPNKPIKEHKPVTKKYISAGFIISIIALSLALIGFMLSFFILPLYTIGFIICIFAALFSATSIIMGFRALRDEKSIKVKLILILGFCALLFSIVGMIIAFS